MKISLEQKDSNGIDLESDMGYQTGWQAQSTVLHGGKVCQDLPFFPELFHMQKNRLLIAVSSGYFST